MTWPLSQDYNEAIQLPAECFGDPELRGGQAAVGPLGLPAPRSGNFADVYEFQGAGGSKWAIKCFTREVPALQERYHEISKHLLRAKLPFSVDFTYLPRGIRIGGQCYPVLKMTWVDGFLLNEFVRNNLGKPKRLEGLVEIWVRLGKRLREAGIAHGDLQHGNVILVPGRKAKSLALRLIDYDGMYVPALAQRKSGEVGHPCYQHPRRIQESVYNADVDRLPLLLTACALRALIVGGKALWDRYDNGDNLLFRAADLRQPAASTLLKELWNLPNAAAQDLAGYLALALAGPLERVPIVDELMAGDEVRPLSPAQEQEVTAILGPTQRVTRRVAVSKATVGATRSSFRKVGLLAACLLLGLGGAALLLKDKFGLGDHQIAQTNPSIHNQQANDTRADTGNNDKPLGQDADPGKLDPGGTDTPLANPATKPVPAAPQEKSEASISTPKKEPGLVPLETNTRTAKPRKNKEEVPKASNQKNVRNAKAEPRPVIKEIVQENYSWDHLDISEAEVVNGSLTLKPGATLKTKAVFDGAIEITAIIKMAGAKLRLYACNGAGLLFDGERDPGELKIFRPDGINGTRATGSQTGARCQPPAANRWCSLSWRITHDGMKVRLGTQTVLQESGFYLLTAASPVSLVVSSTGLEVKTLTVRPLPEAFRTAVPAAAAVAAALAAIHKEWKAELAAARTPAARVELSRQLLKHGLTVREPARRFAVLKEARDVAARAFDLKLAFRAVAELAYSFQIEPINLKTEAVEMAKSYSRNPLTDVAIAEVAVAILPEAHQADAYDRAEKLLAIARAAAYKAKAAPLSNAVLQHAERLKEWRKDYGEISGFFKRYEADPGDQEANLALGKYFCFRKNDWSKGLPLLQRGRDRLLADLAKKDLQHPHDATAQVALGRAWWELAENDGGHYQSAMKDRARHWFRQALPYLSGEDRTQIEDRLKLVFGAVVLVPGLAAEYFRDEQLKDKALSRVDHQVGFYWGERSPAPPLPADRFSVQWRGWLLPPRLGKYKLAVHADDGCRLFVEGKLVIDAWNNSAPRSVTLPLLPRPHHLLIQHHESNGPATMLFTWEQEGGFPEQVVPMRALFHQRGLTRDPAEFTPPSVGEPANGLSAPGITDCAAAAVRKDIIGGFNIGQSWTLSFEFQMPDLDNEPRALFLWGDDRAGLDPIFVRVLGQALEAGVCNCHEKTGHVIKVEPSALTPGNWLKLTFGYHAATREVELYLDDKLVRREISSVFPTVDQPMPVWLGGANAADQRFRGKIRNVRLGNYADEQKTP